jgi:DNA-binding NtrC family response regulator
MTGQIMIVENDPMIVQLSRDLLRFDGHTGISAKDGMEGLQPFSARQFDVVFTDVKMPKMDGIELLKAIKSKDPTVEVNVITGCSSVELAIDVIRYGGYDFLQKPDDVTRLHRNAR